MFRMRFLSKLMGLGAAVAVAAFLMPTTASAQVDCGKKCKSCGDERYEGYEFSAGTGVHNMNCSTDGHTTCDACPFVVDAEAARVLAKRLSAATVAEAPAVAAAYGDRLALSTGKNIVGIRGTGCTSDVIEAYVYVTPGKMAALALAGVGYLRVDDGLTSGTAASRSTTSR